MSNLRVEISPATAKGMANLFHARFYDGDAIIMSMFDTIPEIQKEFEYFMGRVEA